MNVKVDRFLDHYANNVFGGAASENGITDLIVTGTSFARILGKNLKWLRFTIYKGNLSVREHLNIFNNTILNSIKKETYLDYFFNKNSFYQDGSDVRIRDFSGNGNDGIVTGFSGATPADQLNDLLNNVIDINLLR